MKKIIISLLLCVFAFRPIPAYALLEFPILDERITPLPVLDIATFAGRIAAYLQQFFGTIEEMLERQKKDKEKEKVGNTSPIQVIFAPVIESPKNAYNSAVRVLKGTVESLFKTEDEKGTAVNFENPEQVVKTIEQEVVVSKAFDSEGVSQKDAIREQYYQESLIEAMAQMLYYKKQLMELSKTLDEISSVRSAPDTTGAVSASSSIQAIEDKIKVLEQKILLTSLDFEAAYSQYDSEPVPEAILSDEEESAESGTGNQSTAGKTEKK